MTIETFNGFLMSRDTVLAEIGAGQITQILNDTLLPIYIRRTHNLAHWLEKRAIDSHRTNSRLLKKALRLAERDDISTVLSVNGVTITDNYWVKPESTELTWNDVKFRENYFDTLALNGDFSAFSQKPSRTPELTNLGSFEKCWKLEDGRWWMYKKANHNELFSELFIYHLGKALGFKMAYYEACGEDIRSVDFTENASVNFEAAYGWMGDNDDYLDNYRSLMSMGCSTEILDQYVEILLLDSFCMNVDRHTFNYGVLRNVETGDILGMAPNFDNNIALIYNGYKPEPRNPEDLMGRMLWQLEDEFGAVSGYVLRRGLPAVTPELIDWCTCQCENQTGIHVNREYIRQFVMTGYENTPVAKRESKFVEKP
ncbi:MAG: hypothetical protein IJ443_08655 [Firmicutes bacterium]|nr:hypothetical protein [Bacillota bacterium]